MALKIGAAAVAAMYIGNASVLKMYRGPDLVFTGIAHYAYANSVDSDAVTSVTGDAMAHDLTDLLTVASVTANGGALTLGVQSAVPGTAGLITMNADGTYDYDPNGNFPNLKIGQSFQIVLEGIDSAGETFTLTITVVGREVGAYQFSAHLPGEFNHPSLFTVWTAAGSDPITLTWASAIARVANNNIEGDAHIVTEFGNPGIYTYVGTNPVTSVGISAGSVALGDGDYFDLTGQGAGFWTASLVSTTLTVYLSDGVTSISIAGTVPANRQFTFASAIDHVSGNLSLAISDSASSAVEATAVPLGAYNPMAFIAGVLAVGDINATLTDVTVFSPDEITSSENQAIAAALAVAHYKVGPTFVAPSGLSLAEAQTNAMLSVGSGLTGGLAPYTWEISAPTGSWSGLSINNNGVITAAAVADLTSAGTAGALVTVTDARGLSASDTISVAIATEVLPTSFASARVWLDASQETAFSDGGVATTPNNWISAQPDFTTTSSGTAPLWNVASAARPVRFSFDGVDDFIGSTYKHTIGASDGFTIIAVFRGAGGDAFGRIADMRGTGLAGDGSGWVLLRDTSVSPTKLQIVIDGGGNGSAWNTSIQTDTTNDMIVFAATYSAATGVMTVRSPISATNTFTGMAGQAITPNDTLTIGGIAAGSRSMAGDIPEVQYYEAVLTDEQIADLLVGVNARADTFA